MEVFSGEKKNNDKNISKCRLPILLSSMLSDKEKCSFD